MIKDIYLSNIEPEVDEPITLRLRTKKDNVTKAFIEISNDSVEWRSYPMSFEKVDATGFYDYFIVTIPGQQKMFKYRFYCENDNSDNAVYYARTYVGKEGPLFTEKAFETDLLWCLIPGYKTPDWSKGNVWYSIMPDAFYNGDPIRDELSSGDNTIVSWNVPHHFLHIEQNLGLEKFIPECRRCRSYRLCGYNKLCNG